MNIIGEIIIVRAIEERDCNLLLDIINDEDIENMIGGWSFPVSYEKQLTWIRDLKTDIKILRGIIEVKENKKAIGVIMLTDIDYKNGNAQVHIKLKSGDIRGKGYGSDAIKTIVKYGFEELRLHTIFSNVNVHNHSSLKMLSKCGFEKEGVLRGRSFKRGQYIDIVSLSITLGDLDC